MVISNAINTDIPETPLPSLGFNLEMRKKNAWTFQDPFLQRIIMIVYEHQNNEWLSDFRLKGIKNSKIIH